MSSPASTSITRSSSLPSLFRSRAKREVESAKHQGLQSVFLGYELPSSLRLDTYSLGHEHTTSADSFSYSPPPSPTLNSFMPRFASPGMSYTMADTPSLLNETLPSTISSPLLAHTPMPYTTTRDPRPDEVTLIGLGISGLFLQNGTVFDGMGVLPRRDECTELGFFMDEADQACGYGNNEGKTYPEHEEDAWRKRIGTCTTLDVFNNLGEPGVQCSLYSSSTFWSPPAASSPFKPYSQNKGPLPIEPETDDLFYTRSPTARASPHELCARSEKLEISRTMVSSWFRSVQSPGLEDMDERLANTAL